MPWPPRLRQAVVFALAAACATPTATGPSVEGSATTAVSVFAGHAVRPCSELPDPILDIVVDGELSDDPEVASAQRGRAALGFASDLETVLAVMADPVNVDNLYGIPMTPHELTDLEGRDYREQRSEIRAYLADHTDTFGFLYVDQQAGGVFTVGFTRDLDARRTELADAFPDVPIEVVEAEFTKAELETAREPLTPAMQDGRLSLGGVATGPFRVEVYLPEPSRKDLDTIAEVTDSAKVCVRDFRTPFLPSPTTSSTSEGTPPP